MFFFNTLCYLNLTSVFCYNTYLFVQNIVICYEILNYFMNNSSLVPFTTCTLRFTALEGLANRWSRESESGGEELPVQTLCLDHPLLFYFKVLYPHLNDLGIKVG